MNKKISFVAILTLFLLANTTIALGHTTLLITKEGTVKLYLLENRTPEKIAINPFQFTETLKNAFGEYVDIEEYPELDIISADFDEVGDDQIIEVEFYDTIGNLSIETYFIFADRYILNDIQKELIVWVNISSRAYFVSFITIGGGSVPDDDYEGFVAKGNVTVKNGKIDGETDSAIQFSIDLDKFPEQYEMEEAILLSYYFESDNEIIVDYEIINPDSLSIWILIIVSIIATVVVGIAIFLYVRKRQGRAIRMPRFRTRSEKKGMEIKPKIARKLLELKNK